MTARVAIDLALDRLFDYEVPGALEKKLAVGQLLSVPFGRREARGFAVEIADAPAARSTDGRPLRLKPVSAIVDERPFFTPALLELARRIAAYTAAPLESVLRAAVPAAVVRRNAHARELLFVEPVPEFPAGAPNSLTARQRWLHEQIVRLDGGWMGPLCSELGTTPASLRALAARGAVKIAPRAKRRDPLAGRRILPSRPLPLNEEQRSALDAILGLSRGAAGGRPGRAGPAAVLLHGVTGSGKTEVYLQAIAACLAAGRGAIVLVPEIALTPQTVQRFASRFGDKVAVLHSALSDGERYDEWHRIRGGEARVVIGPRSAVFAPVANLGLIVVDEEHEPSYKQDETPRYNARDAAVLRGAIEGAAVVLGSATPSLESWANAKSGKYACVTMSKRAGSGTPPGVRLVDMREGGAGRIFSAELLESMRLRIARGEQTILFLNRRGWARSVNCEACGFVATCGACDTPYTYHRADDCLRCHVCGGWAPVPRRCPQCGSEKLSCRGVGTQRVESALAKCLPGARILRMDADSTSRRHSHDDLLSAFRRGEADVLLGTQMIAKGLDFPNVTLVGVLNADSSLNMPDFRAGERTFQLVAQVAGRAGRAELPGEVVVQTSDPDSPVIRNAARGDYGNFAEMELKDRRCAFLPPYCHLAVVGISSPDLRLVTRWGDMYAKSLASYAAAGRGSGRLDVSEALPSAMEKADGRHRWQIVLRSVSASLIVSAWRSVLALRPPPGNLRLSIDMDAHDLV